MLCSKDWLSPILTTPAVTNTRPSTHRNPNRTAAAITRLATSDAFDSQRLASRAPVAGGGATAPGEADISLEAAAVAVVAPLPGRTRSSTVPLVQRTERLATA